MTGFMTLRIARRALLQGLAGASGLAFVAVAQTPQRGGTASEDVGNFMGSNRTLSLQCQGGEANILGSHNTLVITGECTTLKVLGSRNTITVSLRRGALVQVAGGDNRIAWTTADGQEPRLQVTGRGNTLARGR